jgi:hypothetical protein
MRQALIDGISALTLGTFAVSQELPWDAAGTPLYLKNPKVFYVDEPDSTESSDTFNTLCAGAMPTVSTRVTEISVFVTVDAKQKPSNYDALVSAVRGTKTLQSLGAVRSRECDVSTTFEADRLVTQFDFRFTELVIT